MQKKGKINGLLSQLHGGITLNIIEIEKRRGDDYLRIIHCLFALPVKDKYWLA